MKLSEIKDLLDCRILCDCEDEDPEISLCMSSDMMSDVLAFASPGALLVTGLTNAQSVRTADFADASGIIYLRGKKPEQPTVELARRLSIPLFCTELGMFEACGRLHAAGCRGAC